MQGDHALVCVFTHPDGRSRPLGVTRNLSDDGWYVLLYNQDGETVVYVYPTIGECDANFYHVIEYWTLNGFAFNRSVEIPVPPFLLDNDPKVWADGVLDSVVIPTKRR